LLPNVFAVEFFEEADFSHVYLDHHRVQSIIFDKNFTKLQVFCRFSAD